MLILTMPLITCFFEDFLGAADSLVESPSLVMMRFFPISDYVLSPPLVRPEPMVLRTFPRVVRLLVLVRPLIGKRRAKREPFQVPNSRWCFWLEATSLRRSPSIL